MYANQVCFFLVSTKKVSLIGSGVIAVICAQVLCASMVFAAGDLGVSKVWLSQKNVNWLGSN